MLDLLLIPVFFTILVAVMVLTLKLGFYLGGVE